MGALYDHIYTSLEKYGHAERFEVAWSQKPLAFPIQMEYNRLYFTSAQEATQEAVSAIPNYGTKLSKMLFDDPKESQVWLNSCMNLSANVFWVDEEWNKRFRCQEYQQGQTTYDGWWIDGDGAEFMYAEDTY